MGKCYKHINAGIIKTKFDLAVCSGAYINSHQLQFGNNIPVSEILTDSNLPYIVSKKRVCSLIDSFHTNNLSNVSHVFDSKMEVNMVKSLKNDSKMEAKYEYPCAESGNI